MGKPQSFISKCHLGERRMDMVEIYAFCHAIGISLKDFAGEIEVILDEMQKAS